MQICIKTHINCQNMNQCFSVGVDCRIITLWMAMEDVFRSSYKNTVTQTHVIVQKAKCYTYIKKAQKWYIYHVFRLARIYVLACDVC